MHLTFSDQFYPSRPKKYLKKTSAPKRVDQRIEVLFLGEGLASKLTVYRTFTVNSYRVIGTNMWLPSVRWFKKKCSRYLVQKHCKFTLDPGFFFPEQPSSILTFLMGKYFSLLLRKSWERDPSAPPLLKKLFRSDVSYERDYEIWSGIRYMSWVSLDRKKKRVLPANHLTDGFQTYSAHLQNTLDRVRGHSD